MRKGEHQPTDRCPCCGQRVPNKNGRTQAIDVLAFAERQGGTIRATELRDHLVSTGQMGGNPKNRLPHVYQLIDRTERFERIEPGVFRLTD